MQCIEIMNDASKNLYVQDNYNIYCHDYKTITTVIPVDSELGTNLKKAKTPYETLTEFI